MKSYVKSLDTIRAIAVTFVIYFHWRDGGVVKIFPWGPAGVEMFFTLSGFLITSILLEARDKIEIGFQSRRQAFKQFYIRRSMRIFPIYYVYVGIVFFSSAYLFSNIKSTLGWYLSYTQNILFYKTNAFDEILSHLWSLAVEEQFYLFWPALIFFMPKRFIGWSMGIITLIGILTQYMYYPENTGPILTYQCMDCFGLGGLLAYFQSRPAGMKILFRILVFIGLVATVIYINHLLFNWPNYITRRTYIAIVTTAVIYWLIARQGRQNYFLKLFWENPLFTFIGKISYGMYMYHLLLFVVVRTFYMAVFGHSFEETMEIMRNPVRFLILYAILILLSWASYQLFEKKFLKLKNSLDKPMPVHQLS